MKASFVITISGAAGGEDGDGVAELDWEHKDNLDDSGNLKSTFFPGEEPVFVVNLPPEYRIDEIMVHRRCGGATLEPGTVTRSREEEATFTNDDQSASLSYYPSSAPVVDLYTVPASKLSYIWAGKTITAKDEEFPVIGIINYEAECQQVTYTSPSLLSLADETEVFKVAIDVRTVKS